MNIRTVVATALTVAVLLLSAPFVEAGQNDDLIATINGYTAEQAEASAHVQRWRRALAALGVDNGYSAMTATEAQTYADRGWGRWVPVVAAIQALEQPAPTPQQTPSEPPQPEPVIASNSDNLDPTSYGNWADYNAFHAGRVAYDTSAANSMVRSTWAVTGTAIGSLQATWTGRIVDPTDGVSGASPSPNFPELYHAQIHLRTTDTANQLIVETSWMHQNGTLGPTNVHDDYRRTYSRYTAHVEADGTFSTFQPDWVPEAERAKNPTGVNGTFYNFGNAAHGRVAGHIVTHQTYGLYSAHKD